MENALRNNQGRARSAILMLWVMFMIYLFTLGARVFQYNLLSRAGEGESISEDIASLNDASAGLLAVLTLVCLIVSAVFYIRWFRRAYYNLHQKMDNLKYAEHTAAWSWFVPFVTWYIPYRIMRELYDETDNLLFHHEIKPSLRLNANYVDIWWTLWVIASIVGQVTYRIFGDAETAHELLQATIADIALLFVQLPMALLAIKVVRDYSQVEQSLHEIDAAKDMFAPDVE